MAIYSLLGHLICYCDNCKHLWLAETQTPPKRCGNAKKRCAKWNNSPVRVLLADDSAIKPQASAEQLRDAVKQLKNASIHGDILMPVIPEVAEQARKQVAGMCDHGREAKKCSYCARSRKLLNW